MTSNNNLINDDFINKIYKTKIIMRDQPHKAVIETKWYKLDKLDKATEDMDLLIINTFKYLEKNFEKETNPFHYSIVVYNLKYRKIFNESKKQCFFTVEKVDNSESESKPIKEKEEFDLEFNLNDAKKIFNSSKKHYSLGIKVTVALGKILEKIKEASEEGVPYVIIGNSLRKYSSIIHNIDLSDKSVINIIKSELINKGFEVDLNTVDFDYTVENARFIMSISGWAKKEDINKISI